MWIWLEWVLIVYYLWSDDSQDYDNLELNAYGCIFKGYILHLWSLIQIFDDVKFHKIVEATPKISPYLFKNISKNYANTCVLPSSSQKYIISSYKMVDLINIFANKGGVMTKISLGFRKPLIYNRIFPKTSEKFYCIPTETNFGEVIGRGHVVSKRFQH